MLKYSWKKIVYFSLKKQVPLSILLCCIQEKESKKMKRRKLVSFILLLFVLTNLLACDFGKSYKGEDEELFTVAVHSVLGADGFVWKGDRPMLEVIEEDNFGRKLFLYYEKDAISPYSMIISQKTSGDYVYYYSDYNFICNFKNKFSDEDVEALKQRNDWGKSLQEDKMICKKISKEKVYPEYDYGKVSEALSKVMNTGEESIQFNYVTSDAFGRSLYYLSLLDDFEKTVNSEGEFEYEYYLVILQNDYAYNENSMIKLNDNYHYQEQLSEFKKLNNWDLAS